MPRVSADKVYTNYVGGLITEAGPLNFPDGASADEMNMLPTNTKSRVRRLGMDYESGSVLTSFAFTNSFMEQAAISSFEWKTVAENAAINFQVMQVGNMLYFFDLSVQPLSLGQKSFTVDLDAFAQSAVSQIPQTVVSMTSGNGLLFVSSPKIKSFFVEFDEGSDSITSTEILLQIRDFEGLVDNLDPSEEPVTLSNEHHYNLRNQGWIPPNDGGTDPITTYFSSQSKYPPNSKQWWQAKDTSDNFSPADLTKIYTGNTLSPKGHYIVDVLDIDRTAVSGVGSFDPIIKGSGPSAISFFASRVWYGIGNTLYFSQVVERNSQIGKCYQEQDPTAEILNELLPNDGGTIPIPDMGSAKVMFVSGNSLIIFASNGTWSISGSIGAGFKADDFVVDKISDIGIASPGSLVDIEGSPVWWSKSGIYTIGRSETTDRLVANSLTDNTIKQYYDDTPEISREYVSGSYDSLTKQVQWLWKSEETTINRHSYDMILILDTTTGGFYPQKIESLTEESPFISGVFSTEAVAEAVTFNNVVDGLGNNVVDGLGNNVVSRSVNITAGLSQIRYIAFEPDQPSSTMEFTFSALNNVGYKDWEAKDGIGIDCPSYLETGDVTEGELNGTKQINYLFVFLENDTDPSCFVQTKWDFTNSGSSGRWSKKRQAYRNVKETERVTIAKMKSRGSGKGLRYRFESESGKDMRLVGWSIDYGLATTS